MKQRPTRFSKYGIDKILLLTLMLSAVTGCKTTNSGPSISFAFLDEQVNLDDFDGTWAKVLTDKSVFPKANIIFGGVGI